MARRLKQRDVSVDDQTPLANGGRRRADCDFALEPVSVSSSATTAIANAARSLVDRTCNLTSRTCATHSVTSPTVLTRQAGFGQRIDVT